MWFWVIFSLIVVMTCTHRGEVLGWAILVSFCLSLIAWTNNWDYSVNRWVRENLKGVGLWWFFGTLFVWLYYIGRVFENL